MSPSTLAPSIHRNVSRVIRQPPRVYHDHRFTRENSLPVRSSSDDRSRLETKAITRHGTRHYRLSGALDFLRAHRLFFFVAFPFVTIDTGRRSFSFIKVSIQSREGRTLISLLPAQTFVAGDAREIKQPPFLRWASLSEKSFLAIC